MSDVPDRPQEQAAPVDFVALAAGHTVGRYEIVCVLGQGGFGITYRARDSQLGRDVAIKEYLPPALAVRQGGTTVLPRSSEAANDFGWGRDRFVAEGRTLANLQRVPAIVRVYDFLEANGTAYIVMEFLSGETLGQRLKEKGPLASTEIGRILSPLLDGLEQVHNAGFLHRDIKPANILLDVNGNPTLIDFGASRAAIAGRSTPLTAIFTPGYAAPEQMTSTNQGPWTDIYGLAATLYHAVTGKTPPNAFDRVLDDTYEPVAKAAAPGFPAGLLAGIDAGLAVRASDRPQSIAAWRPMLARSSAFDTDVTVLMRQPARSARALENPPSGRPGRWRVGAVAALLALAGGYYALVDEEKPMASVTALQPPQPVVDKAGQEAQAAAEAQRLKDQEELARFRAEAAEREKAQAEAEARRKVEEDERNAETSLRLTLVDRQRIQVALTALGYDTRGTDGTLGAQSREMIGAWQRARHLTATGFLNGSQHQALLREAAPALAKYDDEQRRLEEEKRRTVSPPPALIPSPQVASAAPPGKLPHAADGFWEGTYECQAPQLPAYGAPFSAPFQAMLVDGHGVWTPRSPGGTLSISLQVVGDVAQFVRVAQYAEMGLRTDFRLAGRFDGRTISASGREQLAGRVCSVTLRRKSATGGRPGIPPN